MKESVKNEVVLEAVTLKGFRSLMTYVYTGQLKLKEFDLETMLDVLQVANMYGFEESETALCLCLEKNLSIENACPIYGRAHSQGAQGRLLPPHVERTDEDSEQRSPLESP